MKKLLLITAALVLPSAAQLLAEADAPSDTSWSSLALDTTGETKNLLPTYPVPYSAKWATNDYERTFSLLAVDAEDVTFSYGINTFAEESEGAYAWDYAGVPPSELPRGATYNLAYTIAKGAVVFDSGKSEVSVTLLPEPALGLLLAAAGFSLLGRKIA